MGGVNGGVSGVWREEEYVIDLKRLALAVLGANGIETTHVSELTTPFPYSTPHHFKFPS